MTIDDILREMQARDWSQTELAARAGMDKNYLHKSLADPKPGKKRRRITIEEMAAIERAFASEPVDDQDNGIKVLPGLGKVPAGNYRAASDQKSRGVAVPDPSVPDNAYALIVEGHSMDLIADDGTKLIIDPDDIELWPGSRYIIRTEDGETTFKEFAADPARLIPCSSLDTYGEMRLGGSPITILGRVIAYLTNDLRRKTPRLQ